jgi:glucose-6-phosphate dehydrogenase assembly protein OpcA
VRHPEFRAIAGNATKVVIDSAPAEDGTGALERMAEVVQRGSLIADLAWTRLTRWRETLARVFANRDTLARLAEVTSVRVSYGAGYETAAWYLAAWAAGALEDVGQKVTPVLEKQEESLRLELSGETFRVSLSRDADRLIAVVNDQSNCTNLPRPTDYLLMREELGIVRRDAVFERTLARAAGLAVSSKSGKS